MNVANRLSSKPGWWRRACRGLAASTITASTTPPPSTAARATATAIATTMTASILAALLSPQPSPHAGRTAKAVTAIRMVRSSGPAAGPATAEYIYRTADGRLHMRVVRTAAKQFPTYHWGNGEWVLGWPDKAVPYRLPELLAAPADAVVLVCEGEKDCDAAARYGFVTTCNPGGAGKWQPELTRLFQRQTASLHHPGQR